MVVTERAANSEGGASHAESGPLAGVRKEARRATAGLHAALQEELDGRLRKIGEQVSSGASDLRALGEKLEEQGRGAVAHFAQEAAGRVDEVGRYLAGIDGEQMMAKGWEAARCQPWLVAASCFAVGFVVARLIKAGAQDEEDL